MAGTPLYSDIHLDEQQVQIVADYIREVDFHLPGASPSDFEINPRARYLGFMFQEEDLEAYGVGLQCTAPGMTHLRTFIRMSRQQLLGDANAQPLPVNDPVLAAESMTLHRFYRQEGLNLRHGVDTYAADEGLAGADMDLAMLEAQLGDIIAFHNGAPMPGNQEILDLKIFWGSLLAGRYSRLKALRERLSSAQEERLARFESDANACEDILLGLGLPTFASLETTPVQDG